MPRTATAVMPGEDPASCSFVGDVDPQVHAARDGVSDFRGL
jgi:hypothetical protein